MPLRWDERLRMPRAELLAFLTSSSTALFILWYGGRSVGLCEFDGVGERDVELKRRLRPYLLDWSLRSIWNYRPDRVRFHTDPNDHPKAKLTYESIGFSVYTEALEECPEAASRRTSPGQNNMAPPPWHIYLEQAARSLATWGRRIRPVSSKLRRPA